MKFNIIIEISEHLARADYSLITCPPDRVPGEGAALGAIITSPPERVRPLQVIGLFCSSTLSSPYDGCSALDSNL